MGNKVPKDSQEDGKSNFNRVNSEESKKTVIQN